MVRRILIEPNYCPHPIKELGRFRIGPKASLPSCPVLTQTGRYAAETNTKKPKQ